MACWLWVDNLRKKISRDGLALLGMVIVLAGITLIAHHGLSGYGWMDVSDPIGHDWLGLVLVIVGAVLSGFNA